jgi:hypothetical protein
MKRPGCRDDELNAAGIESYDEIQQGRNSGEDTGAKFRPDEKWQVPDFVPADARKR